MTADTERTSLSISYCMGIGQMGRIPTDIEKILEHTGCVKLQKTGAEPRKNPGPKPILKPGILKRGGYGKENLFGFITGYVGDKYILFMRIWFISGYLVLSISVSKVVS